MDRITQTLKDHPDMLKLAEKLKPHHIMQFATGATSIPGCGFGNKPTINFIKNSDDSYLQTSTCSCRLSIPVTETTKDLNGFIFVVLVSLSHGGTFTTT